MASGRRLERPAPIQSATRTQPQGANLPKKPIQPAVGMPTRPAPAKTGMPVIPSSTMHYSHNNYGTGDANTPLSRPMSLVQGGFQQDSPAAMPPADIAPIGTQMPQGGIAPIGTQSPAGGITPATAFDPNAPILCAQNTLDYMTNRQSRDAALASSQAGVDAIGAGGPRTVTNRYGGAPRTLTGTAGVSPDMPIRRPMIPMTDEQRAKDMELLEGVKYRDSQRKLARDALEKAGGIRTPRTSGLGGLIDRVLPPKTVTADDISGGEVRPFFAQQVLDMEAQKAKREDYVKNVLPNKPPRPWTMVNTNAAADRAARQWRMSGGPQMAAMQNAAMMRDPRAGVEMMRMGLMAQEARLDREIEREKVAIARDAEKNRDTAEREKRVQDMEMHKQQIGVQREQIEGQRKTAQEQIGVQREGVEVERDRAVTDKERAANEAKNAERGLGIQEQGVKVEQTKADAAVEEAKQRGLLTNAEIDRVKAEAEKTIAEAGVMKTMSPIDREIQMYSEALQNTQLAPADASRIGRSLRDALDRKAKELARPANVDQAPNNAANESNQNTGLRPSTVPPPTNAELDDLAIPGSEINRTLQEYGITADNNGAVDKTSIDSRHIFNGLVAAFRTDKPGTSRPRVPDDATIDMLSKFISANTPMEQVVHPNPEDAAVAAMDATMRDNNLSAEERGDRIRALAKWKTKFENLSTARKREWVSKNSKGPTVRGYTLTKRSAKPGFIGPLWGGVHIWEWVKD